MMTHIKHTAKVAKQAQHRLWNIFARAETAGVLQSVVTFRVIPKFRHHGFIVGPKVA